MEYQTLGYIDSQYILCCDPYNLPVYIRRDHGGGVINGLYKALAGYEEDQLKEIVLHLYKEPYERQTLEMNDILWEKQNTIMTPSKSACLLGGTAYLNWETTPDRVSNILNNCIFLNDENSYEDMIAKDIFYQSEIKDGIFWQGDVGIIATGLDTDYVTVYYGDYRNKYSGYKIVLHPAAWIPF